MDKLDILNRKEFVDNIFNLTQQLSYNKKNASFAIDGKWGVGKSFVLDMYEERLSLEQSEETNKDRYFVIRYNCWKYDYYEEPLMAIVSAMIESIEEKTKLFPDSEKKSKVLGALKAVVLSLLSMTNTAVKQKTGLDLEKAFEVVKNSIDDGAKHYEEIHNYDVYFGFNKAMSSLRNSLKELSEEFTIVFLVDELDRCLPEYAIKVLERLHHLTENAQNTIMVIAIDKKQLEQSIKNLFGFEESKTYLKKFIEFEVELNSGTVSEKFVDKYAEYIDLFDPHIHQYEDPIEEFMQAVFQKIEAREQEQLVHRAMLVHKLLFEDKKDYSFMCIEILSIVLLSRYGDKKKFTDWFDGFYPYAETSNKKCPPFDFFFNTKFSEVSFRELVRMGGISAGEYSLMSNQRSLYGAIAYIWYSLYMKENHGNKMEVENIELRNLLDNNVEELKRFIDSIKIIK